VIKSLANSSITNEKKYRSMMAGSVENNADHLIAETVLTSGATSVTFDTSALGALGYKHLQLRMSMSTVTSGDTVLMQFNGDSTSNYRVHSLRGYGSSASSADYGSRTSLVPCADNPNIANAFAASITDILDFNSTSKNKVTRSLAGATNNNQIMLVSGVWFSTAAITSIYLYATAGNIASGSRFSLYASKG
jgi:hypothetical protein